ncbi:MAG: TIGR01777 family oxidoreductase [Desulfotalea sp.]
MARKIIYQKQSKPIPAPPTEVYKWHDLPGVIERLIPPWQKAKLLERSGGLGLGGKTILDLSFGPFTKKYIGEHLEEQPGEMFTDIQSQGPFKSWRHEHSFLAKKTASISSTILDDKIEYELPMQSFLPTAIFNHIHKQLDKTFHYRHETILNDFKILKKYKTASKNILISGASGSIGKRLIPLLKSCGHRVWKLVRCLPNPENQEIYWNPKTGKVGSLPHIDGLIHLAGEYIGLGRWSSQKKQEVLLSRKLGTETLAKLAADKQIDFFLSSSATGYYGNIPEQNIGETQAPGSDFISQVCKIWEDSTTAAKKAGIRTVILRMGAVLDCGSGVLQKLSSAGLFGVPRYFGSGDQFMSWICMDDLITAILHCIATPIAGPVNICSPTPITNKEFMAKIANIGKKIILPPIPKKYLQLVYGQMANEIALASSHVSPEKLIQSGFEFYYPSMESCLNRQLGHQNNPKDKEQLDEY